MWNIFAIVLGVGALLAYVLGAKQGKPWGVPALLLLVIGTVAAVIVPMSGVTDRAGPRFPVIRMIGENLKDDLEPGARVLFIMNWDMRAAQSEQSESEGYLENTASAQKEALEEALGFEVTLVDAVMAEQQASAFNDIFDEFSDEDVDLTVSLAGLPRSQGGGAAVDQLALDKMPEDMLFVGDVGIHYAPDEVEQWLEEGIIDGVILHPSRKSRDREVVTSDSLDKLPAQAP